MDVKESGKEEEIKGDFDPPIWAEWKVGGNDINGEEIKNIIGQSEYYIVYYVKNGWMRWQYERKCIDRAHLLEAETQILLNRGKSNIKNKNDLFHFKNMVASALVHSFNDCKPNVNHKKFFKEAGSYLEERLTTQYQYYYLGIPTIITILLVCFLIAILFTSPVWLSNTQVHFIVGAICGCFGAYISILQRFDEIGKELNYYSGRFTVATESLARLALGVGFGAIFVVCQKAGIVLEVADDNMYLIALFGLISGINERLIPTLLSNAESVVASGGDANNQSKADA